MSIRRAAVLVIFSFIALLAWGAYGGFHYGWGSSSPFSWLMVQFPLVGIVSVAWLNLWYRINVHLKEEEKHD